MKAYEGPVGGERSALLSCAKLPGKWRQYQLCTRVWRMGDAAWSIFKLSRLY